MQMTRALAVAAVAMTLSACVTEEEMVEGPEIRWPLFGEAVQQNRAMHIDPARAVLREYGSSFQEEADEMVTFAFDTARLDAAARAAIDTQVAWLTRHPDVRMSVIGHADLVGPEPYNYRLGLARAGAVVDYMVARGIARNRLDELVSRGENDPLVETLGPERLNRRVMTTVAPLGRQFAEIGMDGRRALTIYQAYLERPVVVGISTEGGGGEGEGGGE